MYIFDTFPEGGTHVQCTTIQSITIRYIIVQVIQPHVCADVREDNPRALAKPYNIWLIAPACICT